MKIRSKSINKLKLEIQDLEEQIKNAETQNRKAFASRLNKIKSIKEKKLENWILNS